MSAEHLTSPTSFEAFTALEPQIVKKLVPDNGAEQRDAFLAGDIQIPDNSYGELDIDYDDMQETLRHKGDDLVDDPAINPKFTHVYQEYVKNYQAKYQLLQAMHDTKKADTDAERAEAGKRFMDLNREAYGTPDEPTYRSLLSDKINALAQKNFDGEAAALRDELFGMVSVTPGETGEERFRPEPETIEWMHEAVTTLYGNLLRHVPEGTTLERGDVVTVFETIFHDEFGDSAEGWKVVVEPANSVNVRTSKKELVIPESMKPKSSEVIRGLVVHEIGVHVLRSIIGNETDLPPLATGLKDYYDFEEGLGVVMEQALKGEYLERGIPHYLMAGGAYFDGKDFRESFETRWRMDALSKLKDGEQLTTEAIEKAQRLAYGGVMRIMRGTDSLPLFKDLAYFNGAQSAWKHLEAIRGDDTKFMFLLLGKADPSSIEHERVVYETSTP